LGFWETEPYYFNQTAGVSYMELDPGTSLLAVPGS
jgi:hypothetical protein